MLLLLLLLLLLLQVWAPRGGYLMRGITRANVMALCREHGVTLRECDFYLTQVRRCWRSVTSV
jgi:hypothetical protein